ncbi:MAG: ABC transporter permease subunit, partial [Mesorhizobium sp.]
MSQSTEIAPMASGSPDRLTGFRTFWHYFSVNRGAVIGLFVFILLVLAALFAPLLAPYAPDVQDKTAFLRPPAWQNGGSAQYLLGTDAVGRDILSRLLYGARFSLLIGAVVVTLALTGGITLGLLAGYFRGWVDVAIMRVMDLILAFPSLLLALVLVTILGPGLFNAMLAISLVLQPHFARLVRAAVMAEKSREYVV